MISRLDRKKIVAAARRYGAATVLLFGSSARRGHGGRDIDLAVTGVAAEDFFKFYGELLLELSQPVDVVLLRGRSKFASLIRREGIRLYGRPARKG
jgi:predicted nucleotidyltransferase